MARTENIARARLVSLVSIFVLILTSVSCAAGQGASAVGQSSAGESLSVSLSELEFPRVKSYAETGVDQEITTRAQTYPGLLIMAVKVSDDRSRLSVVRVESAYCPSHAVEYRFDGALSFYVRYEEDMQHALEAPTVTEHICPADATWVGSTFELAEPLPAGEITVTMDHSRMGHQVAVG